MLTTQEDILRAFVVGLFGAIVLVVAVSCVDSVLDQPDVHFSNSTGECVKVLNYAEGDLYSCDNMPKRYNHVWVQ
jgi:hypothetical protein